MSMKRWEMCNIRLSACVCLRVGLWYLWRCCDLICFFSLLFYYYYSYSSYSSFSSSLESVLPYSIDKLYQIIIILILPYPLLFSPSKHLHFLYSNFIIAFSFISPQPPLPIFYFSFYLMTNPLYQEVMDFNQSSTGHLRPSDLGGSYTFEDAGKRIPFFVPPFLSFFVAFFIFFVF